MLHTKYQESRPYDFRHEDFLNVFHYISLCKLCDPLGGAILTPGTWFEQTW